ESRRCVGAAAARSAGRLGEVGMSELPLEVLQEIKHAYRLMAERAHYQPLGPLDEFESMAISATDLDLEPEMAEYAAAWWAQEDASTFRIGCCNAPTRAATIFVIEAAKAL